ncbi:uncharacterized protein BP5553_04950 [Venustampulla echinocandica]|uniref:laccase n=1 Tax=Venustampulla echinocandica TaxID=2656787 RepID=A0A370TPQ5_9HELO|nr:uncharacterized protein BP5553_04950 [Venustampulla echinocandica]RDL37517.1 hypothetical protein BP5553_04950 [Venustampulla echinocandica]
MLLLSLMPSGMCLMFLGISAACHIKSLDRRLGSSSATDRYSWDSYDTSTNYYTEFPDTGVTVEVYLELVNTTVHADGYQRNALLVNGTLPGPTIIANWGDTVVVHLHNGLTNNGTALHFHGIRQYYSNEMDGVPSVTQCPVAPGESITYKWRATQYGSAWYHSHFELQAWEGVFGGIIIHGPATANYDNDAGIMFLSDWTHQTADAMSSIEETSGPPSLDNGLINGTNTYHGKGSRFEMTVTKGESYRIRLVNSAIDTHFKFMIDNHTMTVIAMDLVPIVPYTTTVLSVGMGQRYDIIVDMTEAARSYWIRAIPQTFCSDNNNADNIKGILRYDSAWHSHPTTSAHSYIDDCDDEKSSNLVPYLPLNVGSESVKDDFDVTAGQVNKIFKWFISGTTFFGEWANPTLLQIYRNDTNFTASSHVIELNQDDEWVYFIIQTTLAIPHPIHLHGHDFYILAHGTGVYSSYSVPLSLTNPPRRDVAMLPASGYLVIAIKTDNPGAWLMHCHIGWHLKEGFALQLVERRDEILPLIDYETLNQTCTAWDAYTRSHVVVEDGSGV